MKISEMIQATTHFKKGDIILCKENNYNRGVSDILSHAKVTVGKSYVVESDSFSFINNVFI